MKRLLFISLVCLLCACSDLSYKEDPSLTCEDKARIQFIRKNPYAFQKTKDLALYHMVSGSPEQLVKTAAGNGDFRPIGVKILLWGDRRPGAPYSADDATIIPGLDCYGPIKTKNIDIGVYYHLARVPIIYALRYNLALYYHSGFPAKGVCKVDRKDATEVMNSPALKEGEDKECPKYEDLDKEWHLIR